MVGGRNHAAAGSKSENARVSLRRVRAGSLEAIDGEVRAPEDRTRPDAASGGAGGFASGVQARSACERGGIFAEEAGGILRIRAEDSAGSVEGGDAVCGAPVGVGLGRRGVAATRAGDDGGVQRGRLLFDGEAAGLAGRGTAEVGGTGNRRSPTAR